jgi:hypothetical protein
VMNGPIKTRQHSVVIPSATVAGRVQIFTVLLPLEMKQDAAV